MRLGFGSVADATLDALGFGSEPLLCTSDASGVVF